MRRYPFLVPPTPPTYDADAIRAIRLHRGWSWVAFARALNVRLATIVNLAQPPFSACQQSTCAMTSRRVQQPDANAVRLMHHANRTPKKRSSNRVRQIVRNPNAQAQTNAMIPR